MMPVKNYARKEGGGMTKGLGKDYLDEIGLRESSKRIQIRKTIGGRD